MTDLLPGQILHILLVGVIDAALLSWFTLAWYRRSVRRYMGQEAPVQPAGAPAAAISGDGGMPSLQQAPPNPAAGLEFGFFDLSSRGTSRSRDQTTTAAAPSRRRLVMAYITGAALWSAVVTLLQLVTLGDTLPVAWLVYWWVNGWLIVPTITVLLALEWRVALRSALTYALGGAVITAVFTLVTQIIRGSVDDAPITNAYWMLVQLAGTAALPALVLVIAARRRTRAVLPLALSAVIVFGVASLLFHQAVLVAIDLEPLRPALSGTLPFGSVSMAYYGLFMLVALPVGLLSWWMIRWLAAGFERKHFSDVQIVVDCWWIIVTALETSSLAVRHGFLALPAGLAAFLVYRLTVAFMLRRLPLEPHAESPRLTLLRVFGFQARTEALFDRVAQRWRFQGPVQLIAGEDLAMRTTDPGDLLGFLQGQLAQRYVRTEAEIPHRLRNLDDRVDPDGRFRVNEIYCHDDTWRSALKALLDESDRVLADLRSFGEHNAGCRYELTELLGRVDARHVAIVYDRTTDLALLSKLLAEAWDARPHPAAGGPVALVRIEQPTARAIGGLLDIVNGGRAPERVVRAADLAAQAAT